MVMERGSHLMGLLQSSDSDAVMVGEVLAWVEMVLVSEGSQMRVQRPGQRGDVPVSMQEM